MDRGLIFEGDYFADGEGLRGIKLSFQNTCDHDGAEMFGHVYGDASDATDGADDENSLSGLDCGALGDELVTRGCDDGECGRVKQIKTLGNFGGTHGGDGGEFGIGVVGECEDLVSDGQPLDAGAELGDGSGDVVTEDAGEFDGEDFLYGSGSLFQVDWIDGSGGDTQEDFAGSDDWVWIVFIFQNIGGAVLVNDDGFHIESPLAANNASGPRRRIGRAETVACYLPVAGDFLEEEKFLVCLRAALARRVNAHVSG